MLNSSSYPKTDRKIKIVQFGEGNFLRGFVDYMVDIANEKGFFDGSVAIVKPIASGSLDAFYKQDCIYTVYLRGVKGDDEIIKRRVITSISEVISPYEKYDDFEKLARLDSLRFVVSNTTEAGIVLDETDDYNLAPPKTFPGKLTQFLHKRYEFFGGNTDKGLIMLPVELIDDNGKKLYECVKALSIKWNLGDSFLKWLDGSCIFCSTLVDRIVTGFPKDEAEKLWKKFGYTDKLIVTAEPFALWVIESAKPINNEFPLDKAGLPVIFTDNHSPYKQRKVRILNGAHTSFSLASFLMGNNTVLESMNDDDVRSFMIESIYNEIIPTLDLPKNELMEFAESVVDRFKNPYIKHLLLSISLNSVSKWKARCLPSVLKFVELNGTPPKALTFTFAALLEFYNGKFDQNGSFYGIRNGEKYEIHDDKEVLEFFAEHSQKPAKALVDDFDKRNFMGRALPENVKKLASKYLESIREFGMRKAMEAVFGDENG